MQSDSKNTGARVMSASIWMIGSRLIAKSIDFVLLLCLARLLGPEEFGLVAIAMAAVLVIEALFELPVSAALISVENLTDEMLNTAFTLGVLRGIMVASLLLLVSIPISSYSNEPKLIGLLAVLSLAPAFRGMVSPRIVKFTREYNSRPDVIVELIGKVVAFIISISVAIVTKSYWAIVAATVFAPMTTTFLSYVLAPMRPRISLSCWRIYSNLVGWNFVAQLFGAFSWQIDRLILPRFTSNELFGRYAMGKQLSEIPLQALIAPLSKPVMAAIAGGRDDREIRYLKLSQATAFLTVPVLVISIIWPEALVRLGLGVKWEEAAEWLRWSSVVAAIGIPALLIGPVALTLNFTKWLAIRTAVEFFLRVPLVWAGAMHYGIYGAVGALAFATACGSLIAMRMVNAMLKISLGNQLLNLVRPLIAAIPAAGMIWLARYDVAHAENTFSVLTRVTPLIILFFFLYLFAAMTLWHLSGRPAGLEEKIFSKFNLKFSFLRKI